MKKTFLILSLAVVALGSCKKKKDDTPAPAPIILPTYTVDGIHDLYISANSPTVSMVSMPITVEFRDSFQKVVTLALSELPAGIAIDENWSKVGYPTFATELRFYDTSSTASAAVGTYPMTLTATGAAGTKTFTFNLNVTKETSCSDGLTGYFAGTTTCSGGYQDTVFADAVVPNRVWFKNFGKTGKLVFGTVSCINNTIKIPAQTIGGFSYSGSGYVTNSGAGNSFHVNFSYGTNDCSFTISN